MGKNEEIQVLQAYTRDVGRGVIRLSKTIMRKEKILEGDTVVITGKKITVGKVLKLYPSEEDDSFCRMDGLMRNNAGIVEKEGITIQRIEPEPANEITVMAMEAIPPIDGRYLAEALESVSIIEEDSVMVPYFGGRLLFQVVSTIPSAKVVEVVKDTRFIIIERLEKGKKSKKLKLDKKQDDKAIKEFIARRIFSLLKDSSEVEQLLEKTQDPLLNTLWLDFNEIISTTQDTFPNNDFIPNKIKTLEELNKSNDVHIIHQYFRSTLRKLADALEIKHLEVQIQNKNFGNDIFIVHGHDEALKEKTARFIEKLDLKPIILHEQPNKGRTIIEKFEDYTSKIGFAVILLTPDDICTYEEKGEKIEEKRGRQNVVLELGFFAGAIGRKRICVLHSEDVKIPSDYDGVVYVPIDKNDAWKLSLAKEIKEAGILVDLNKIV